MQRARQDQNSATDPATEAKKTEDALLGNLVDVYD
jgi:hypothetical protein